MDTFFSSNPSTSKVSWCIKLICAPESKRFAYLYKPLRPHIFWEITGSKTSDFPVIDEILALTLFSVVLWSRGWWYRSRGTSIYVTMHGFLRLQVFKLWSFPQTACRQLKQAWLKQAWLSCAILLRSSRRKAKNVWHSSVQYSCVLQIQHLLPILHLSRLIPTSMKFIEV